MRRFASGRGEKARSISAAMIPTGKNSSIIGGGGNDGKINGKTTIDAARTASSTKEPTLGTRLIWSELRREPYLSAIFGLGWFVRVPRMCLIKSRREIYNGGEIS